MACVAKFVNTIYAGQIDSTYRITYILYKHLSRIQYRLHKMYYNYIF